MGPDEHVHRVDLHQTDAVHDPTQVPDIDTPRRASIGEALCGQGDSPGLTKRKLSIQGVVSRPAIRREPVHAASVTRTGCWRPSQRVRPRADVFKSGRYHHLERFDSYLARSLSD